MHSAMPDHYEACKYLLTFPSIQLEAGDKDGCTALHLAGTLRSLSFVVSCRTRLTR